MRRSVLFLGIAAILVCALPGRFAQASGEGGNDQADVVYGQPNMYVGEGSCASPTATSLCVPLAAAIDDAGNLWVADAHNNRVVMYSPGSTTASKVLGQPNLTSNTGNNEGISASSMYQPLGIAIDGNGTLFVSDGVNNRVLVFFHAASKPNGAAANLVLGQSLFTTNTANNTSTVGGSCLAPSPASNCTLFQPWGLKVDDSGDLLVADGDNNRVLLYPASDFNPSSPPNCGSGCFIAATQSWGQFGSLLTNNVNRAHTNSGGGDLCPTNTAGNPSQCTLNEPSGEAVDAQGDLFVADQNNNRVLEYDNAVALGSTRQNATMVYGQRGSFTSGFSNNGGITATSLVFPTDVAVDSAGNLWVADQSNNRVLEYPPAVTGYRSAAATAVWVLGQRGSMLTNDANEGGVDGGTLSDPNSITTDGSGDVFVSDDLNNRVLEYQQPYLIAARVALAAGWNLVSIADSAQLLYTASSVVRQIDNQGGLASEVAVFSGGAYQVFVPGFSTDFSISPKQGVWVLSGGSTVWAQS